MFYAYVESMRFIFCSDKDSFTVESQKKLWSLDHVKLKTWDFLSWRNSKMMCLGVVLSKSRLVLIFTVAVTRSGVV